jgi:hypothetical protein
MVSAGAEYHLGPDSVPPELMEELIAAHIRHIDVRHHKDESVLLALADFESLFPIVGRVDHIETESLQILLEQLTVLPIVIGNNSSNVAVGKFFFHHSSPCKCGIYQVCSDLVGGPHYKRSRSPPVETETTDTLFNTPAK